VAAALTRSGHEVVVLGRTEAPLRRAVAEGAASGYRIADVTEESALAAALADIGAVDILVNNAGSAESAPLRSTDLAMLRRMLAVHVESVFTASRAVLPGMVERRFGRIVSIASTASLKGYPFVTAYAAAKHAVLGFTRALALEVVRKGVTVNAVCPAYTDTDLLAASGETAARASGKAAEDIRARFVEAIPMGRLIAAEEVADAVAWLAGPGAGAVTGQAIAVAGGEV
jgi:NAD(P)-dependent dehydrogenase (short-subunit alcohol dehydrogenase family)